MPAPQFVRRSYAGGAVAGQLSASIGATDTSFTISPTTGWVEEDGSPLGTAGPFTVAMDLYTPSVEKVLCSAINLSTGVVTVYVAGDGWSGRGYDGTTPIAHVPGTSSSGVQPCWSSVEADEANQAVYDLLGGGGATLVGVPIGTSVPFNGTPLTLPSNFKVEDGSAISRTTYSAAFTAITIATTGTTTNGNATINSVPAGVTQYIEAGMALTLTHSGGAVYTVASVGSTSIVLTSGTGITAGTAGAVIVYPHGAGDGSTTFNLPDSRGRSKIGQGAVNTNAQPTQYVGQTVGIQSVTISQSQLPVNIGTAAAQSATVNESAHDHYQADDTTLWNLSSSLYATSTPGSGSIPVGAQHETTLTYGNTTGLSVTNSASAVTNSGGGAATNVQSPGIGCTWIMRVT